MKTLVCSSPKTFLQKTNSYQITIAKTVSGQSPRLWRLRWASIHTIQTRKNKHREKANTSPLDDFKGGGHGISGPLNYRLALQTKIVLGESQWVELSTPGTAWVDGRRWKRDTRGKEYKIPLDALLVCQIPQLPQTSNHASMQIREAEHSYEGGAQPWLVTTAARLQWWFLSRLLLRSIKFSKTWLVKSMSPRLFGGILTGLYIIAILCPLSMSPYRRSYRSQDSWRQGLILTHLCVPRSEHLVVFGYEILKEIMCWIQSSKRPHFLLPASETDKISIELTTVSWLGCSLPSLSIDRWL